MSKDIKILQQKIRAKTRKLQSNWIIEQTEIAPENWPDVEDDLARILSEEIDNEVVNNIREIVEKNELMKKGWVKAPFGTDKFSWPFEYRLEEVSEWIHLNATGEYRIFGKEFWFQSKKDLTAFILKWS